MTTTALTLDEIHALAYDALTGNGADHENASALAQTIMTAERDGSVSHGLFRLPAYISSLRSGKANGSARPKAERVSASLIRVDGDHAYAPMSQAVGLPLVIEAARESGVAILALTRTHHMAALWPEVEALAEAGLAGFACVSYMPMVAPAGAKKALFGTNPIAFAWPRPGKSPLCYDMATAAMAMGEVQVAAREGHAVPAGTGLDKNGEMTTDPAAIADGGVLLPFGGYKGSAIAMMVELLAAGLLGEQFSFEAKANDNGDGGRHAAVSSFLPWIRRGLPGRAGKTIARHFSNSSQASMAQGCPVNGVTRTALIPGPARSTPRLWKKSAA